MSRRADSIVTDMEFSTDSQGQRRTYVPFRANVLTSKVYEQASWRANVAAPWPRTSTFKKQRLRETFTVVFTRRGFAS